MNKSWLSDSSTVEPPKRKAPWPSERLMAWAWQPAWGLWASGREALPVRAQESSNENLLGVSHRHSVTARFGRNPFNSVSLWISPHKTVILTDRYQFAGMMDGFWGWGGGGRRRSEEHSDDCNVSSSLSHLPFPIMIFPGCGQNAIEQEKGVCEAESTALWLSAPLRHTHTHHCTLRWWLTSVQVTS